MWSENRKTVNKRVARLADGTQAVYESREQEHKLSKIMAMILGAFLTIEIMIGSAMVFNYDVYGADKLAILFAFIVLYLGVVAVLTDR